MVDVFKILINSKFNISYYSKKKIQKINKFIKSNLFHIESIQSEVIYREKIPLNRKTKYYFNLNTLKIYSQFFGLEGIS